MNAQSDNQEVVDHQSNEGKKLALAQAIEETHSQLLSGIRALVWKMGMADDPSTVISLANDILQDTIVTAFEIAYRYEPDRPAHAWILGIAANKVREMIRKVGYKEHREPSITTLHQAALSRNQYSDTSDETRTLTEDEMLGYLMYHSMQNPKWRERFRLSIDDLLSLVDDNNQAILKLAFVHRLKGKELAATLGISEGAANVRLSRAIRRLREAYEESEKREEHPNV